MYVIVLLLLVCIVPPSLVRPAVVSVCPSVSFSSVSLVRRRPVVRRPVSVVVLFGYGPDRFASALWLLTRFRKSTDPPRCSRRTLVRSFFEKS